jgi:hypothetical protein
MGVKMRADNNSLYLLYTHADAISKNQYLPMWIRIVILGNAGAVNNRIRIPFIYINSLK